MNCHLYHVSGLYAENDKLSPNQWTIFDPEVLKDIIFGLKGFLVNGEKLIKYIGLKDSPFPEGAQELEINLGVLIKHYSYWYSLYISWDEIISEELRMNGNLLTQTAYTVDTESKKTIYYIKDSIIYENCGLELEPSYSIFAKTNIRNDRRHYPFLKWLSEVDIKTLKIPKVAGFLGKYEPMFEKENQPPILKNKKETENVSN